MRVCNSLAEERHRSTPQRSITLLANNEFCYPGVTLAPLACSPAADGQGSPQGPALLYANTLLIAEDQGPMGRAAPIRPLAEEYMSNYQFILGSPLIYQSTPGESSGDVGGMFLFSPSPANRQPYLGRTGRDGLSGGKNEYLLEPFPLACSPLR